MEHSNLVEAFERAVLRLPHEDGFRAVEVVSHHARRHGGALALGLMIDVPGGVDVGICEGVARHINRALDAFTDPYTLEVESAGLERPLLRPADYERFRDRRVKIQTGDLIDGRKTHRGVLAGVRGSNVVLDAEGSEVLLPIDSIKTARLEYDPRNDLRRAKEEKRKR
jgi:ribosome maturation factor RimP